MSMLRGTAHRYFKETEGGQQEVCKAIEDMRKRERIETMFNSVKALMESMKWTAEQAMNAMKISNIRLLPENMIR